MRIDTSFAAPYDDVVRLEAMSQSDPTPPPPSGSKLTCITNAGIGEVSTLLQKDTYFWLDLRAVTDSEIALVGEQLGLHPLTIEDLQEFDQRAKVEEYDGYIYLVAYGSAPEGDEDRLAEVHIVYSPKFLLTVARDPSVELADLHRKSEARSFNGHEMLHAVLDTLVDSYAPLLDDIDRHIDRIEDEILNRELSGRDRDIHEVRRHLGRVNRVVHRQSEAYTRLHEALRHLPDSKMENAAYFRDVQDHLIRITESADASRDRVSGVFEIYLAALDNRQNIIMKQFTVIAGIFLPLSVVTGFFGMNFGWMVGHILGRQDFLIFGVGLPLVILVTILVVIWNRGLLHE
ncbi:MAG: magnesium transporter CorA family protein [Solirubrobacterales bacterium]